MSDLREILSLWERSGGRCALATLVQSTGSSYRRCGARMLITASGEIAGGLSAGCIEEEVAMHAREVIATGEAKTVSFDTRRRFGCSGSIDIFIEVAADDTRAALRDLLEKREAQTISTASGFVQTLEPPLRLVVVGSGPETAAFAGLSKMLGWEFIALETVQALVPDRWTAVVIATHNFGRDCAALRYLLGLDLRYVGLIGPRRRREELLIDVIDSGVEPTAQLFAPAGLDLAAEGPAEIALSVVSEIQKVFAGATAGHLRDRKQAIHAPAAASCAVLPQ